MIKKNTFKIKRKKPVLPYGSIHIETVGRAPHLEDIQIMVDGNIKTELDIAKVFTHILMQLDAMEDILDYLDELMEQAEDEPNT